MNAVAELRPVGNPCDGIGDLDGLRDRRVYASRGTRIVDRDDSGALDVAQGVRIERGSVTDERRATKVLLPL